MLWFVLIAAVVAGAFFIQSRNRRHNVDKILCVQSSKRNGKVYNEGGQFYPFMSFLHRGVKVYIYTYPKMKQSRIAVRVHIDILTYRKCQVAIYRNSNLAKTICKDFKRIKLDNDKFNEKLIVRTTDEFFADKILNAPLQNKLLKYNIFPILIDFENNRFFVSLFQIPSEEAGYAGVIDLSLMLYNNLKTVGESEGVF